MLRKVLTVIGIIELVSPEALIEAAEWIALENPVECKRQSWVVPAARVEDLVFLVMMWRSDASYAAFKKLLGLIGVLALLFPRAYIDYASSLAYTEDSTCDWKRRVYPGTRIIGLVYVLIALDELRQ